MGRACKECKWWEFVEDGEGPCHRYPPDQQAVMEFNDGCIQNHWEHPWTGKDDWCGEFEASKDYMGWLRD